ncbi:MAG TPA: flagellum-specific ATP synthase FliI, partial [Rhodobacteraceae bacterium]|nr:flagellum-specific ATP synthase FliI [Paracoccaceae bacterium]
MENLELESLTAEIANMRPVQDIGRVVGVGRGTLRVAGLSHAASLGDMVRIQHRQGIVTGGEVLQLEKDTATVLPDKSVEGVSLGDRVVLMGETCIA